MTLLRMTQKLVHLVLNCKDPTFRLAREFKKSDLKGIIIYKSHFI